MVSQHFQRFKNRVLAKDPRAIVTLNNPGVQTIMDDIHGQLIPIADLHVQTMGKVHNYSLSRNPRNGSYNTTVVL